MPSPPPLDRRSFATVLVQTAPDPEELQMADEETEEKPEPKTRRLSSGRARFRS